MDPRVSQAARFICLKTAAIALEHAGLGPLTEEPDEKADDGQPAAEPPKPSAAQSGVYDGRDYSQWLRTVEIERSPIRLTEAVQALRLLGAGRHDAEVAEAILSAVGRFPGARWGTKTPEGLFLPAATEQMRHLDPEKIVAPVIAAFRSGHTIQRNMVITLTYFGANSEGTTAAESLTELLGNSEEMRDTVISVWDDLVKSPTLAASAYDFLIRHWMHGEKTHRNVIGFLKKLADAEVPTPETRPTDAQTPEQRHHSQRYMRRLNAAFALTQMAPDHPSLTDVFVQDLTLPDRDDFWANHAQSVVGLLRLRSHAVKHLPRLISVLQAESDLKAMQKSSDVLRLTNGRTEQTTELLISRRIVLAELVALIARADQSTEAMAQVISLNQKIQEQSPKKDEVTEQYLPHVRKTQFVVPRLAETFDSPDQWVQSTSGTRYMVVNSDRGPIGSIHPTSIEPHLFQQTALSSLSKDSPEEASEPRLD